MVENKKTPKIRFAEFTDAWELRKLGEWGSFYYGHSCPKWSVTDDATTPCIRYGELYTKFGTKIDKVFSYTNMPTDKLRFSKGTEVLIPRVGEDPMAYNHCTWLSKPGVAIGEMISVFNTEQNPLFSATMFNAILKKEFASRVEGGSVTNLYYEKLKNIDVLYPSIAEQEKVAAYFECLDNLITLHQRKYDKLVVMKKSMLEKMFPRNGSNVPEIRFAGFTDVWEQRKFEEIFKLSQGLQIEISKRFTEPANNRYFYITNEFLKENCDEKYYIESPSENVICDEEDILMTRTGNTGIIVTDVKGCFHNNFFKIQYDKKNFSKKYICYLLSSVDMQKTILNSAGSSTIPDLSHKSFYKIEGFFPIYKEQIKVGEFFSQLDNLITLHQRKLEKLKKIKKSMLEKMFV
jgi:type I restriction enzyme S subunit